MIPLSQRIMHPLAVESSGKVHVVREPVARDPECLNAHCFSAGDAIMDQGQNACPELGRLIGECKNERAPNSRLPHR